MSVIVQQVLNPNDLILKGKKDLYSKTVDTLQPFLITKSTSLLPFAQGISKGGTVPIHKDVPIKFIGKLLERQVDDMDKAAILLKKNFHVFLSVYCGYGKTICSLFLACLVKKRVLVIDDRQLISNGWTNVIPKFTNCQPYRIKGGDSFIPQDALICTIGIDTLRNMDGKLFKDFGTVIVDEALSFCTQLRVDNLLKLSPQYLIGLSADLERPDGFHEVLPLFFGPMETYIRRISDKRFSVYKFNTTFKPVVKIMPFTGNVDWNHILDTICLNEERNRLIAELAILNAGKKVLILCKRVEQCKMIHGILQGRGVSSQLLIGNQKSYSNCDVLVATFSKAGKGFDDENCCLDFDGKRLDLLILASDLTNPEQFIGRVFRSQYPTVYHLVDDFSSLKKHWKEMVPWILSRNGVIVEEWL